MIACSKCGAVLIFVRGTSGNKYVTCPANMEGTVFISYDHDIYIDLNDAIANIGKGL